MGMAEVRSVVPDGVEAREIRVEAVTWAEGHGIDVIGLPDVAVKEARLRVQRAATAVGVRIPRRAVINLAPASLRKEGSGLDLPMATAFVAASLGLRLPRAGDFLVAGEIGLDGRATRLPGALMPALLARKLGVAGFILPLSALPEASLVDGLSLHGVEHLSEVIEILEGRPAGIDRIGCSPERPPRLESAADLAALKGQETAKWAAAIAAVGGHNMLMVGPPGSGKTMLARSIVSILPPLSLEEALDAATVHAAAGLTRLERFYEPPFRAPHHTASRQALIGGGLRPRPGEVSLAHRGLLFLDELPEFGRSVLEVLRQPLEDREVTIARSREVRRFPADFMLFAAMNPCPCGFFSEPGLVCRCTPTAVKRYRERISGPLLDRFDLHVPVRRVALASMLETRGGLNSAELADRVAEARARQDHRAAHGGGAVRNSSLSGAALERAVGLDEKRRRRLADHLGRLDISGRAFVRILRVARSLADLAGEETPGEDRIFEAIQYRFLDREGQQGAT